MTSNSVAGKLGRRKRVVSFCLQRFDIPSVERHKDLGLWENFVPRVLGRRSSAPGQRFASVTHFSPCFDMMSILEFLYSLFPTSAHL